ncbi:hypothetical protein PARHAE_00707 [Paracoccus haematequi]|uniref:Uncharacterized protein n=1 Tax=Paracoccus haematequi TaxID=2491866 RepID=A0A3S5D3U9_9RHOB|nr:hypothetical protein [Paracoccus haematequi]VDS07530.1 hypothetical protein PARHAE_00707 [Paracoccus haematequi]
MTERTLREKIAALTSYDQCLKRPLAMVEASDGDGNWICRRSVLAILDAQTEQPDLQLSARKVEGDAPDQTEVSSGPSAAPTDNTALVEALDVCLEWIDAVPSDTPLPAMPGFDRDWVDNIRNRAALASREAKPAPDAVAEACDPASIIAAVCKEMNGNGFTSKPRIAARAGFDLSKFKEQRSDYAGVETEWVDQRGPGMCGDDFYGTLAVPIDAERLFVVEYYT